ncbi:MAG: MotA/TolQ/ExbB proton channel family protein [Planctomycetaceae bacterium]|nr:MotA/TolQ/ExbB proton channel family protein [Planctomycetaceae bacterium]
MNREHWVPEFLRPFDWSMGLLVIVAFAISVLTLQRIASYIIRRQGLRQMRGQAANKSLRTPEHRPLYSDWPEVWREDRLLQSMLGLLKQLATMFGLAGTVCGILQAFSSITGDTVTMRELGPAMALALKTTLYGAICACVCMVAERLPFQELQHAEQELLADLDSRITGSERANDLAVQSYAKGASDDAQLANRG